VPTQNFDELADLDYRMSHAAPDRRLTVEQAHQAMRDHLGCRARLCPCKEAALQCLADEGRLILDNGHPR
jgi:hypothetical protein